MVRRVLVFAAIVSCLAGGACRAQDEEAYVTEVRNYVAAHVVPWLREAVVLDSLQARNLEHGALTDVDIEHLDQEWARQVDAPDKPLINSLLFNDLSKFLREKMAESRGYVSQVIVMDAKGMSAGLGVTTEDYWQGDEDKWQKSFKAPRGAVFIDKVEKARANNRLSIQVSLPVEDPGTGRAIGAITVFIDVGHLSATN